MVDRDYAAAVAKRFGQWVLDSARDTYQAWLDYHYEIGLRHHRKKKNKTDHAHTVSHIGARDVLYDAWLKSMILQATLWVQPYIKDGDF